MSELPSNIIIMVLSEKLNSADKSGGSLLAKFGRVEQSWIWLP